MTKRAERKQVTDGLLERDLIVGQIIETKKFKTGASYEVSLQALSCDKLAVCGIYGCQLPSKHRGICQVSPNLPRRHQKNMETLASRALMQMAV